MLQHILCPVDGSPQSDRAVDLAADLAQQYGAKLTLLHVAPAAGIPSGFEHYLAAEFKVFPQEAAQTVIGRRIVEEATQRARRNRQVSPVEVVDRGDAAERILALAAEQKADCIVVGRRGHGRLAGLLLGGVSNKVAQLASCTVMLVR